MLEIEQRARSTRFLFSWTLYSHRRKDPETKSVLYVVINGLKRLEQVNGTVESKCGTSVKRVDREGLDTKPYRTKWYQGEEKSMG